MNKICKYRSRKYLVCLKLTGSVLGVKIHCCVINEKKSLIVEQMM